MKIDDKDEEREAEEKKIKITIKSICASRRFVVFLSRCRCTRGFSLIGRKESVFMRDAHNGMRILAHARANIGCVCVCVMHWCTRLCPSALGRLARVSHQQLMAGATQLVVTGAFARASLSTAAYQLRLTRKPRSESMYVSRKECREKVISLQYARSRRYDSKFFG